MPRAPPAVTPPLATTRATPSRSPARASSATPAASRTAVPPPALAPRRRDRRSAPALADPSPPSRSSASPSPSRRQVEQNEQMTRQLERVFDSVLASVNFVLTFLSFLCPSFCFLSSPDLPVWRCLPLRPRRERQPRPRSAEAPRRRCLLQLVRNQPPTSRRSVPLLVCRSISCRNTFSPSPASPFVLFSLFRKESGECKFGESCRFAHEDLPEKEAKIEA